MNKLEHAPGAYVAVNVTVSPSASLADTWNTSAPIAVSSGTGSVPPKLVKTGFEFKSGEDDKNVNAQRKRCLCAVTLSTVEIKKNKQLPTQG